MRKRKRDARYWREKARWFQKEIQRVVEVNATMAYEIRGLHTTMLNISGNQMSLMQYKVLTDSLIASERRWAARATELETKLRKVIGGKKG